jgi:hypothetical protein
MILSNQHILASIIIIEVKFKERIIVKFYACLKICLIIQHTTNQA